MYDIAFIFLVTFARGLIAHYPDFLMVNLEGASVREIKLVKEGSEQ